MKLFKADALVAAYYAAGLIISFKILISPYNASGLGLTSNVLFWSLHATYLIILLTDANQIKKFELILFISSIGLALLTLGSFYEVRGDFFEYFGSDSVDYFEFAQESASNNLGFWTNFNNSRYVIDDLAMLFIAYSCALLGESSLIQKALNLIALGVCYLLSRKVFLTDFPKYGIKAALLFINSGVVVYYAAASLKEIYFLLLVLLVMSCSKYLSRLALIFAFSFFRLPTALIYLQSLIIRRVGSIPLIFALILFLFVGLEALEVMGFPTKYYVLKELTLPDLNIYLLKLVMLYSGAAGVFPTLAPLEDTLPNFVYSNSSLLTAILMPTILIRLSFAEKTPKMALYFTVLLLTIFSLAFIDRSLKIRYFIPVFPIFFYMLAHYFEAGYHRSALNIVLMSASFIAILGWSMIIQ